MRTPGPTRDQCAARVQGPPQPLPAPAGPTPHRVTVPQSGGGAPARAGGETPRVADSSAAGACRTLASTKRTRVAPLTTSREED